MLESMAGMKQNISREVQDILERLQSAGFLAYVVGGSVRDLLRGAKPKDWDITTSAKPEEIQKLFPESFYENKFLTVTVRTGSEDTALREIEITTFRAEGKYTDKRHPDEVQYAKTLEEDLARRDFTVNAIAMDSGGALVDPFGGQKDLEKKMLCAVGNPNERFEEDALRMMRAARLATELSAQGVSPRLISPGLRPASGWEIEKKTATAITKQSGSLQFIAHERIRDELIKIIESNRPKEGFEMLHGLGLLKHIVPELEEGIGMEQRGPHKYDVWEHNLRALAYAADQGWSLTVRIAALLHDVGKSRTRVRRGGIWTFYGHDVVGAHMSGELLTRLHFPSQLIARIATLVRWHLFSYKLRRDDQYKQELAALGEDPNQKDIEDSEDMQETTDSSIRRLIRNVGEENIQDLVRVRICDRIATGVPKAVPYRLRHFQFRVEKILREGEATNVKMLALRGGDLLEYLQMSPGPRVGHVLNALLEEVLDDPKKNTKEYLLSRAKQLSALSDEELVKLREQSQEKIGAIEEQREQEIKKKYHIK